MTDLHMRDDLVAALQAAGYLVDETYLGLSVWKPQGKPLFFCSWPEVGAFLIGLHQLKASKEIELAETILALKRERVALLAERADLKPAADGYWDMVRLVNQLREENRQLLKRAGVHQ